MSESFDPLTFARLSNRTRPIPSRLTAHALAVIEAAVEQAEAGPVQPTPAIRLALGWLTLQGLTEPWQVEQFWHWLRHDMPDGDRNEVLGPYVRRRDLRIPLTAWQNAARK